jgi:hypothetical protein
MMALSKKKMTGLGASTVRCANSKKADAWWLNISPNGVFHKRSVRRKIALSLKKKANDALFSISI